MDEVRLKKLEEKEALLRDTFEDALLCLERNSEVSIEHMRLVKSLATIWMASRELIECEKKRHAMGASTLKMKA